MVAETRLFAEDPLAIRAYTWRCFVATIALGIPLLLSGCGGMMPEPGFEPALLEISPDAADGPDFVAAGSIESAADADYFELRIRTHYASVIVMTTGATDTAGRVETADRTPVTGECEGDAPCVGPVGLCVVSYDEDTAHNDDRNAAFNSMEPSGNFVWEGRLPGPTGEEEYRSYFIRVTGAGGSTGDYELAVELNAGPGCDYS